MNIVLIALDTLRADRMSCYGYGQQTTPHIDALAAKGVLFENMIAENNVTQSSFVTMTTGKNPIAHGVVNMKPQKISHRLIALSQILNRHGYTTGAVDNNHRLTTKVNRWFARGYDTYVDPGKQRNIHFLATAEDVNELAIPWLKRHQNEKFFLFLHYWDPHFPYNPPQDWQKLFTKDVPLRIDGPELKTVMREPLYSWFDKWSNSTNNPEYIRALYDAEINYLDDHIGRLLGVMDKLHLLENTLIAIVADHGESLGEHHIYFDHHGLYEATVHVPFILALPGKLPANRRVNGLAQHADILPTILDIAGIKLGKYALRLDGKSLLPLVRGERKELRAFTLSCEANWQLKRAIRTQEWKLIKSLAKDVYGNPKYELYDLARDPGETHNLARKKPQLVKRLNRQLEAEVMRLRRKHKTGDPLARGQKTQLHPLTVAEEERVKQRLSDMGY